MNTTVHSADRPPRTLFSRILSAVEWIEDQMGGFLLLIASILVTAQVTLRALNVSLSGLYEIAAFCALWSVFLTAGVGIQRNIHVRVDVLVMASPPKLAFLMHIAGDVTVIIVTAMLCYSGYLLVEESLTFGDSTLGIISVPMWIPQLIMPVGGVLMFTHALARLAETVKTGPRAALSDPTAGDPESSIMSI